MKLEKIFLKLSRCYFYQSTSPMQPNHPKHGIFIKFQKVLSWAESQLLKESDKYIDIGKRN